MHKVLMFAAIGSNSKMLRDYNQKLIKEKVCKKHLSIFDSIKATRANMLRHFGGLSDLGLSNRELSNHCSILR